MVDQELMRRVVRDEEGAFAAFYSRLAPGLFSVVYEIVRDQKEAEDVLQECFVQMWKKSASYEPARSSLFTWAVMIARHRAIDRVRSRQRHLRVGEAATLEAQVSPPTPLASADDLAEQSDERDRLRAALLQLADGQREALHLAFFSGLTQTEISAQLGAPLGTVKARIRRGLIALRDILEAAV
ncbi:MAG: sigma-70 family RNA polymerase sigma factor [Chthoniobacterales bacterium]|nr:sigma-70 family RNA polymerase sigma factor [Chthoniobacterales bacterium]